MKVDPRGSIFASGFGPGGLILRGSKFARTPGQRHHSKEGVLLAYHLSNDSEDWDGRPME